MRAYRRSGSMLALCVTAAIPLLMLPSVAEAGLFEGFTKGDRYRQGSDTLCELVSDSKAQPTCKEVALAEMSKLSFDKGRAQSGKGRALDTKKRGSWIDLIDPESKSTIFRWNSGEVISEVEGVYLHKDGRSVAIEYSVSFGGRSTPRLVGLRLPKAIGASTAAEATHSVPTSTPTKAAPDKAPPLPAGFREALQEGEKHAKRRRHAKAIAAFDKALALATGHPEALYLKARSQLAAKNKAEAIATLEALAASSHPERARWRVEARLDKAFKSLRADSAFRNAVGIDRRPGETLSAYERLVALGGEWEQESLPCEQPQVNLSLKRDDKSRFDLIIRSKCEGVKEVTRLDGSWRTNASALQLHFPNQGADDEDMMCGLELCSDGSGEDCLRCQPDPDIEFLLRIVRR